MTRKKEAPTAGANGEMGAGAGYNDCLKYNRCAPKSQVVDAPVLDAPHLPAYQSESGKQWFAWCVFCQRWHQHGSGPGHRVAHCHCEDSPYKQTGYTLYYSGLFDKAWLKQNRRPYVCRRCRSDLSPVLSGPCPSCKTLRLNRWNEHTRKAPKPQLRTSRLETPHLVEGTR